MPGLFSKRCCVLTQDVIHIIKPTPKTVNIARQTTIWDFNDLMSAMVDR